MEGITSGTVGIPNIQLQNHLVNGLCNGLNSKHSMIGLPLTFQIPDKNVRFSNGLPSFLMPVDSNHLKTGHNKIRYSDESGIWVFGIQMVTVIHYSDPHCTWLFEVLFLFIKKSLNRQSYGCQYCDNFFRKSQFTFWLDFYFQTSLQNQMSAVQRDIDQVWFLQNSPQF